MSKIFIGVVSTKDSDVIIVSPDEIKVGVDIAIKYLTAKEKGVRIVIPDVLGLWNACKAQADRDDLLWLCATYPNLIACKKEGDTLPFLLAQSLR